MTKLTNEYKFLRFLYSRPLIRPCTLRFGCDSVLRACLSYHARSTCLSLKYILNALISISKVLPQAQSEKIQLLHSVSVFADITRFTFDGGL